jgi:lysozyme family protein
MFKTLYASIIREVIAAESALKGQSGEAKKAYVIDRLVGLVDIPMIPEFIEGPIKRWLFGYVIDLACEKLNWLTDWAFGDVTLEPEQVEKVAESLEAPVAVMSKAAAKPAATLEERISNLYQAYNIEPITPIPVPVSDKILDTTEAKIEYKPADNKDSTWTKSAAFTLKIEGGEVNDPDDKGGHTNLGITEATLKTAYAAGIVAHGDVSKLTRAEALAIYKNLYWDKYSWGELPWPLCLVLFDATVHHGPGGVARIAQKAANALGQALEVDGKYGPKTKSAIWAFKETNTAPFCERFLEERKAYFDSIIAGNASQEKYRKGWNNRLKALAATAGVKSPV